MPTYYTYRYPHYWVTTTDDTLVDYIERFPATDAEVARILAGGDPTVELGVEDPYVPEPQPEDPIEEVIEPTE